MDAELVQAGERLVVRCEPRWLNDMLGEAVGHGWQPVSGDTCDVEVVVERRTEAFDVQGWEPLTRGAYRRDGVCVMHNACGSGFDLRVDAGGATVRVVARWRPPRRERLASVLLPSRFHLLTRAVLLQYPALWCAGLRGRVPLHAGAVDLDGCVSLLAGPGGVGRSTLVLAACELGGRACSDNLVASDVERVYGVVEPMRTEDGTGRRMAHGRRERPLPDRVADLAPDRIVVLRRGGHTHGRVVTLDAAHAARVLTAGTYTAGELRRYWAFAATLALGTAAGPAHPPIAERSDALAARLPAVEITLPARPVPGLAGLLAQQPERSGARS